MYHKESERVMYDKESERVMYDKESERVSQKNRQTDGEKAFSSSIEEEAARLSSREKEPSAK